MKLGPLGWRVTSGPVQYERERLRPRRFLVPVAGGMVVSGVALTVGALGGSALFGRDRLGAELFTILTVVVAATGLGLLMAPTFTKLTASLRSPSWSDRAADRSADAMASTGESRSFGVSERL
jgi:hypothetical protein